jgi:hypothetical protein
MKSPKRFLLILAAGAVTVLAAGAALLDAPAPASAATVSNTVAADLQYMREEEKLARDVYRAFDDTYGDEVPVFRTIAKAEVRHMLAMKRLLSYYHVADPVKVDREGVFRNDELQQLYDDLVDQGNGSREDALEAAIAVEQRDIADLKEARSHTSRPYIKRVYDSMIRASYQHITAFERAQDVYGD